MSSSKRSSRALDFKVQNGKTYWRPDFQAFSEGSWWDVEIVEQRDVYCLARFSSANAADDEAWFPLTQLRLRTRKADDWDCHILKRGMDVSVYGLVSDHKMFKFHPDVEYDGKLVQVSKSSHGRKCNCRFVINFYSDDTEDPCSGRAILTASEAVREVGISNLSLLQQPLQLTFDELLKSHMTEKWLPRRWGNDAFFLREARLTNDHEPPPQPPAAAERPWNSNERKSSGGPSLFKSKGSNRVHRSRMFCESDDMGTEPETEAEEDRFHSKADKRDDREGRARILEEIENRFSEDSPSLGDAAGAEPMRPTETKRSSKYAMRNRSLSRERRESYARKGRSDHQSREERNSYGRKGRSASREGRDTSYTKSRFEPREGRDKKKSELKDDREGHALKKKSLPNEGRETHTGKKKIDPKDGKCRISPRIRKQVKRRRGSEETDTDESDSERSDEGPKAPKGSPSDGRKKKTDKRERRGPPTKERNSTDPRAQHGDASDREYNPDISTNEENDKWEDEDDDEDDPRPGKAEGNGKSRELSKYRKLSFTEWTFICWYPKLTSVTSERKRRIKYYLCKNKDCTSEFVANSRAKLEQHMVQMHQLSVKKDLLRRGSRFWWEYITLGDQDYDMTWKFLLDLEDSPKEKKGEDGEPEGADLEEAPQRSSSYALCTVVGQPT